MGGRELRGRTVLPDLGSSLVLLAASQPPGQVTAGSTSGLVHRWGLLCFPPHTPKYRASVDGTGKVEALFLEAIFSASPHPTSKPLP